MDPCAASEDGEEVVWVEEQSDEGSFVIVKTEDLMDDEAAEEEAGKGKKNGGTKMEEKTKEDVQGKTEENNGTTTAPAPMNRLTAQRPSITISDQSGPSKPSLEENEEEEVEETVKLLGGRPQDRILLPDEISQLSVNESEESEQEEEVPNTGSLLAGAAEKMAAQDWAQKAAKEEAAAAKGGKDEKIMKNGLGEGRGREESAEVATTLFLQPKDSAGTNEGVEAKVEEAKVEEKGGEPEVPRPAAVEADIPTLVFPSTAPPNVVAWLGLYDRQQQQPNEASSEEELKPEEEEKEKTSPALGIAGEEKEAPCRLKIISMDTQKDGNGKKEEEDANQKDADQKSSEKAEEREAEDVSSKSSQPGLRLVAIEQRLVEDEPAAGNRRKSQEEEEELEKAEKNRKRAEERAVQFVVQLPAVNKTSEESEGTPNGDGGEKEDAGSKTEAKEEAKEEEAASTTSKSSRGAQGVRFADGQNSAAETAAAANSMMMPAAAAAAGDAESSEELAQLDDEVEQKMRRKSKEALDLVDRIFGLQAKEAEKKPPIQRPAPLTSAGSEEQSKSASSATADSSSRASAAATASNNSSASTASTAVPITEQEQLKEALAAGVHGLAGTSAATSSSSSSAKAATIGENVFQIGEGPVLDVETVSVNASLLQAPSDCLLLPGQLLLIVDADAGLSLVSLQSKQLQAQLSPRAGVWRNAECACLGGPDGDQVYVLLEYNVNNSEEQAEKQAASTEVGQEAKNDAAAEGREDQAVQQAQAVQQGQAVQGEQQPKKQTESSSESQQTGTTPSTAPNGGAGQPKGILKRGLQAQQPQPTAPPGTMDSQQQQQRRSCEPDWRRFICRFSVPELRMLDRIEAPKWLRERVVWQCRLCWVPSTQCLYLVANTPNQGFLFELRCPQGRWAECKGTRMHSQYADMHHFAVVGPVTELLLLETNRCYVQLLSVYNSTCVQARTLGLCERPGALCVDELGNLLIFDRATSTVGLFSRAYLEKVGDLCLVERAHCQLSARGGLLAVLCRPTRELKLHRYGDRLRAIEQRWLNGGEESAPAASQAQQQRQGVGAAGDDDQ